MTYLRRALKYFIQITLIFAVIMAVLMLSGLASKDIGTAFRNGWKSVELILAAFAAMSLVYPRFGYAKRSVEAKGDPAEHWPVIDEVMTSRGYVNLFTTTVLSPTLTSLFANRISNSFSFLSSLVVIYNYLHLYLYILIVYYTINFYFCQDLI